MWHIHKLKCVAPSRHLRCSAASWLRHLAAEAGPLLDQDLEGAQLDGVRRRRVLVQVCHVDLRQTVKMHGCQNGTYLYNDLGHHAQRRSP